MLSITILSNFKLFSIDDQETLTARWVLTVLISQNYIRERCLKDHLFGQSDLTYCHGPMAYYLTNSGMVLGQGGIRV